MSSYQAPILNPRIPSFGYQIPTIDPFGCYSGEKGKYSKCKCQSCVIGVSCMCLKAKNIPGRGDVLDCHTTSHSSSLVKTTSYSMTESCFTNKYQGYMTSICYCNTPFCNESTFVRPLTIFTTISAFLIIWKDLKFYT